MFEHLPIQEIEALLIAAACGLLIGMEREYHNKSTGIRTLMLICIGAALFGILSRTGQRSDDRIAANIVTGIGFLGAGVIFKDSLSVVGLTTAAVIWSTAAIGMAVGMGYYSLAVYTAGLVLFTLALLHRLEKWVDQLPQKRILTITFSIGGSDILNRTEALATSFQLSARQVQISKKEDHSIVVLELRGKMNKIRDFERAMLDKKEVRGFH